MDILDEVRALEEAVAWLKRVDLNPVVYGQEGVELIESSIRSLSMVCTLTKAKESAARQHAMRQALEAIIDRGGNCTMDCLPGCPIACVSEMSDEEVLRLARERLAELDRR